VPQFAVGPRLNPLTTYLAYWYIRPWLRKLTTWHLGLLFLNDLKYLNQTAPRFMNQELDRNQCIHGSLQKFFLGVNVEILLILFRLLTMQCKWTFTKRFTLYTH